MIGVGVLVLVAVAAGVPPVVVRPVTAERRVGQPGCHSLVRAVPRDAAITPDVVAPVPCRDQAPVALAYDRSAGRVVAVRDLEAGSYLGRTVIREGAAIRKGAALRLISTVGPVRVERPVTAMQPGHGDRIFVRDEDGNVFAARLGAIGVAR